MHRNIVFALIGVIDSGIFKGEDAFEGLEQETKSMLFKYKALTEKIGIPCDVRHSIGTEIVASATELCINIASEFKESTFFTGKVIFEKEHWVRRLLHNETAFSLQKKP